MKNKEKEVFNTQEDIKKLYKNLQYMAVANILLSIAFIMYMIVAM